MSQPFLKLLSICLALVPVAAHSQNAAPPTVTVAAAFTQEVTDQVSVIGRGEAIESVDIVARVTGYLKDVAVANGAEVAAGTRLFGIERTSYEATVDQRKAQLSSAEASLDLANIELDRRRQLVERQASPQSELDIAQANAMAAGAQVRSARAALVQAELELSYTEIAAPFAGRIGRVQDSVGALVGPQTGPLVTLVQTAPIFVSFSVGGRQLIGILDRRNAVDGSGSPNEYAVGITLPDGTALDEIGTIAFGDNRINPTTDTLTVRAEFPNQRGLILDGAFVTVHISESEPVERLLIPQAAVQRDQRGAFVLVVDDQQMVEQRYVTLGQELGTAVVVADGLSEGEMVIEEGLQRVRPGVPVDPVLAGTPVMGSASGAEPGNGGN